MPGSRYCWILPWPLLLDRQGLDVVVLERRTEVQPAPAAHVVNARTFEICRAAGVDGDALAAACRRYLEPLIAGEDYPPYVNGLPAYVRIAGRRVPRKLRTEFRI